MGPYGLTLPTALTLPPTLATNSCKLLMNASRQTILYINYSTCTISLRRTTEPYSIASSPRQLKIPIGSAIAGRILPPPWQHVLDLVYEHTNTNIYIYIYIYIVYVFLSKGGEYKSFVELDPVVL
jgi:hypothetical protein